MGKPYTRLKYKLPESYSSADWIGHGEAVSMITDFLTPDGERWDRRRRVDNHVRYAVKKRSLAASPTGCFRFSEIAAWANERYGEKNSNISRMHHGVIVVVSSMAVTGETGTARGFGSTDDYREELEVLRQENERLRSALAKLEAQREQERLDAEIGRKMRAGAKKGGNSPKEKSL